MRPQHNLTCILNEDEEPQDSPPDTAVITKDAASAATRCYFVAEVVENNYSHVLACLFAELVSASGPSTNSSTA